MFTKPPETKKILIRSSHDKTVVKLPSLPGRSLTSYTLRVRVENNDKLEPRALRGGVDNNGSEAISPIIPNEDPSKFPSYKLLMN